MSRRWRARPCSAWTTCALPPPRRPACAPPTASSAPSRTTTTPHRGGPDHDYVTLSWLAGCRRLVSRGWGGGGGGDEMAVGVFAEHGPGQLGEQLAQFGVLFG